MTQSHRGKPSVPVQLEADRQGGNVVLTREEESVSVGTPGGHEAEALIFEIIGLCDKLIHLVVREEW